MSVSSLGFTLRVRTSSESLATGRKASSSIEVGRDISATFCRTSGVFFLAGSVVPAGTGSNTIAGDTLLSSVTLCRESICCFCCVRFRTIIVRSSSVKLTPAISSAVAIVSLVISAPAATFDHSTPGSSEVPSPIDEKNARNSRRSGKVSLTELIMRRRVEVAYPYAVTAVSARGANAENISRTWNVACHLS